MMTGCVLDANQSPSTQAEVAEMAWMPYSTIIGKFLHRMRSTRPDIAYTVGTLAAYTSNPGTAHWAALKRLSAYLQNSKTWELRYSGETDTEMIGYTDASYSDNRDDRKSTEGYCYVLAGLAICWAAMKQPVVAQSTSEAEYIAMAECAKKAL